MWTRTTRTTRCLASALAAFSASCIYVEEHPPVDPYTYEAEPNDFYFGANDLGSLAVGEQVLVRGHVTDVGTDRFDGFAFHSAQPMDVEFRLFADEPGDDFDLELFDPITQTAIATWETAADPETGFFSIGEFGVPFHLVVSSFLGTGGYTLEVRGRPLSWFGDEATTLVGQGAFARSQGPVDWAPYAAAREDLDAGLPLPVITVATVEVDPDTGAVRTVHERRTVAPTGDEPAR